MAEIRGPGYSEPTPGLARYDAGHAPHSSDPQPMGQDDELAALVEDQRVRAEERLRAHRAELDAQTTFHVAEVERYERILAACEAAAIQLSTDQAVHVQAFAQDDARR